MRHRWLRDLRDVGKGEHTFGAYIVNTNGYYLLTLRDEEAYEELVRLDFSSEWKLLDVNILNTLILEEILGITEEQLSLSTSIGYTKDVDEALEKVRAGEMQVALILNPDRAQRRDHHRGERRKDAPQIHALLPEAGFGARVLPDGRGVPRPAADGSSFLAKSSGRRILSRNEQRTRRPAP